MKGLDSILLVLFSPLLVFGLYYPAILPAIGWFSVWMLRRDVLEWPTPDAWADHFVASLLEDMTGDQNAEASLRREPQEYRRRSLRFFDTRLPWIVPPERLEDVRRRLLRDMDRRVAFFTQALPAAGPFQDAIGEPGSGEQSDKPGNENKDSGIA